jgi:hypothetical protein
MTRFQIGLGAALNAVDVLVGVFLIFGGRMVVAERSVWTGYTSVAVGVFIIYLSTGIWAKGKWKQVTRLVLYAVSLCIVLITLLSFVIRRHEPLSAQTPLPAISALLAATIVFSIIHLRISQRA